MQAEDILPDDWYYLGQEDLRDGGMFFKLGPELEFFHAGTVQTVQVNSLDQVCYGAVHIVEADIHGCTSPYLVRQSLEHYPYQDDDDTSTRLKFLIRSNLLDLEKQGSVEEDEVLFILQCLREYNCFNEFDSHRLIEIGQVVYRPDFWQGHETKSRENWLNRPHRLNYGSIAEYIRDVIFAGLRSDQIEPTEQLPGRLNPVWR